MRRGRSYEGLTIEGERVLETAHRLLREHEVLQQDLHSSVDAPRGTLAIGAVPTAIPVASRFAARLQARQPGIVPPKAAQTTSGMIAQRHVHVKNVWSIPQLWLVWMVLFMNVSAGIGVIGMASPMLQEVLAGYLIGVAKKFTELPEDDAHGADEERGALRGRARRDARVEDAAEHEEHRVGDVGAIHGRLLTAWSAAGILGPVVVNCMRDNQLGLGLPRDQVYNQTMYILVGMLVISLVCNLLIRPVADKWFMFDAALADERRLAHEKAAASAAAPAMVVVAWLFIGLPLAWGVWKTLQKRAQVLQLPKEARRGCR